MSKRVCALAVLLAVAALVPLAFAGEDGKESSLVGEWQGRWTSPELSDTIYLTIRRVEGDTVEGVVHARVMSLFPHHNRDIEFSGKLEGNKLTIDLGSVHAFWVMFLTIDGNKMTGFTLGALRNWTIELAKVGR